MISSEETARLTRKRWLILLASCCINLCIGSMYAWSVFSGPMAEHLNELGGLTGAALLTAGSLAIVFSVTNIVSPVMTFVGGYLHDRFGPRTMIFVGGIIFGAAMILSSFATSLGMLIVTYGFGIGIGNAFIYICTLSNSVKFFPDKRGLVGGIITATYGFSSVILPPVAMLLMESAGVTGAFKFIGIAFLVIVCLSSLAVEKCPDGFAPAGWTPPAAAGGVTVENKTWRQMLADPIFYVMLLLLCCGAVFGLMIISQASAVAKAMIGMSVAAATTAVSILALFNSAGRVCAGFISDKIGRNNTLVAMLGCAIVGLGLLYFSGEGDIVQFYAGVSIVGICFGAFMGVYPGFTADQFGPKYQGTNYGILFLGGFGLAGLIGPTIMTKIHSYTGTYQPAFLFAAGLAFLGIVISFVYRGIMARRKAAAGA